MSKVALWLQRHEYRMFRFVNRRIQHTLLDVFFAAVTRLGGAAATIATSLLLAAFGHGMLRTAALQSLVALAASHIPVAVMKRAYPRQRPYLVFPDTVICKNPLKDHSFPSGHTTAVFSSVLPYMYAFPVLGFALLPLAVAVGVSRMYLGLHYPSDVAAGCLLGTAAALVTIASWM
ncbi:phosphoesterase [Gordoniibacillus kamchatkensis]|uniref:Phosphoesterase n=1 Tax=Gordoniibacillus kamchatkensis TaxID=1590651 RepID=A0ABR5AD63_9BACL|nr:phosphatase PAP2 family protein [Paenibacillus sp. VKM B-2647]KIL38916.1 phosphoesterase [Paenibacillus sp. VKM B-2647]